MSDASKLRRLNFAKSKAAGAPVGEFSELSKPGVGKIPKAWRRIKSKKKKKTIGKQSKKDIATLKAQRDAHLVGVVCRGLLRADVIGRWIREFRVQC